MGLAELLEEILQKSNLSKEEILARIKAKQDELKIISLEGAAYLVAKDLGIELLPKKITRRLEFRNIVPGLRKVYAAGKIFHISRIVEFEKNGRRGKVVNLYVSDGTDYLRIPLWNEQVKIVEEGQLKVGDSIQIASGMAKENLFGEKEIVLGRFGRIFPAEVDLDLRVEELREKFFNLSSKRVWIKDVSPGLCEIFATIVQVFRGKFFFPVCPVCETPLREEKCEAHGELEPEHSLVVSCLADDGTGTLRTVFFGETAERLLNSSTKELLQVAPERRKEFVESKLLGKTFLLAGRVRRNRLTQKLELRVTQVKDLNYLEESKKLLEALENARA